jgi:hypothetical protein
MKLTLAIVGEYIITTLRIIEFIILLPIIITGLAIAQILAWLDI